MENESAYNPADISALMRPRRLCICRAVTEAQIRDAVKAGARTFEIVQNRTNCSTGCGTCERAVRKLMARTIGELEGEEPDWQTL